MTDHVHFDIAAVEATIRASIAEATAAGQLMVDRGEVDPGLFASQSMFDEARVQFTIAMMKCENAGLDRNEMLSAAGFALGSMWSNALLSTIGSRERAVINGWLQQALANAIGDQDAFKTLDAVLRPVQGSRA